MPDVDPELFIDAILMHVDDLGTTGAGADWLRAEFDRVLGETMAGAIFCKLSGFKTQNSQFDQGMPSQVLLAVLTQARKRSNANADGSIDNPAAGCMLIPRLSEFPLSQEYPVPPYPSTVGIPTNYY